MNDIEGPDYQDVKMVDYEVTQHKVDGETSFDFEIKPSDIVILESNIDHGE